MYVEMLHKHEMITKMRILTHCSMSSFRRRPTLLPDAMAECCASVEWLSSKVCML